MDKMTTTPLKGRTAIVTGASRLNGIGAAACLALAEKGANIYFTVWGVYDKAMHTGNHESDADQLLKKLKKYDVKACYEEINLEDDKEYPSLFTRVEEKMGSASILVNNACYSQNHSIDELNAEILDRHYQVNLKATALLSIEFAKRFNGVKGSIVHLTSGQSKGPMMGELAYAATKGAIDALTVTMAAELGNRGITVNAVNPGPTETGWMTAELERILLPKFPFGRIGKPEDAARIIAFLATPEAEWITGQVIHSEGGFLRS
jgi:3-oxoacyl-[acyl-carrier protein] reductase